MGIFLNMSILFNMAIFAKFGYVVEYEDCVKIIGDNVQKYGYIVNLGILLNLGILSNLGIPSNLGVLLSMGILFDNYRDIGCRLVI